MNFRTALLTLATVMLPQHAQRRLRGRNDGLARLRELLLQEEPRHRFVGLVPEAARLDLVIAADPGHAELQLDLARALGHGDADLAEDLGTVAVVSHDRPRSRRSASTAARASTRTSGNSRLITRNTMRRNSSSCHKASTRATRASSVLSLIFPPEAPRPTPPRPPPSSSPRSMLPRP